MYETQFEVHVGNFLWDPPTEMGQRMIAIMLPVMELI